MSLTVTTNQNAQHNAPQTPVIASMIEDTLAYAAASRADSTLTQYTSNWDAFLAFCAEHNLPHLPTQPSVVAVYLSSLAKQGRSVSTVSSHLAAVKHFHAQARLIVNWEDPILDQVVSGIRRTNARKVNKAEAILVEDLALLVQQTGIGLTGLRDRALILTGFAGAFRRSELVALTLENTEFVPEGMVLRLDRSKTDQEGKGAEIAIPFAKNPEMCPVRAVQAWLKAAAITTGPLFRRVLKGGTLGNDSLSEDSVRFILAKLVGLAGLEGKYSPHSLRAGFCTQAAMNERPLEQIARHARHSNPKTTMGYVRIAERFSNHAGDGIM